MKVKTIKGKGDNDNDDDEDDDGDDERTDCQSTEKGSVAVQRGGDGDGRQRRQGGRAAGNAARDGHNGMIMEGVVRADNWQRASEKTTRKKRRGKEIGARGR